MSKGKLIWKLSKKASWNLLLICAFPIHFWAVLQMIKHLEWLSIGEFWGVMKYVLATALVESLIVSLGFWFIGGVILPRAWREKTKVIVLGVCAWGAALFLMIDQYFRFVVDLEGDVYRRLLQMEENQVFFGFSPWLVVSVKVTNGGVGRDFCV